MMIKSSCKSLLKNHHKKYIYGLYIARFIEWGTSSNRECTTCASCWGAGGDLCSVWRGETKIPVWPGVTDDIKGNIYGQIRCCRAGMLIHKHLVVIIPTLLEFFFCTPPIQFIASFRYGFLASTLSSPMASRRLSFANGSLAPLMASLTTWMHSSSLYSG